MAATSTSSLSGARTLLITWIMIFSGMAGLLINENIDSQASGVRTRGDIMGEWDELPTGGWPSSITTGYCEIMYREEQDELVVFNRENGDEWEVWSYFEGNNSWFKWETSGQAPDARYSNQAFTSNSNDDMAFFYGGYRQGSSNRDKLNIFFYSNRTWIETDTPSSLGGRYWSEMVYDNSTDSIWIFGGRDDARNFRDDIFQYNLTDGWNIPDPSIKPAGRDQASMSITPNGTTIHVSLGRYYRSYSETRYKHDLWEYNTQTETWTEITSDLGIGTDAGAIMAYRSGTDDLIITMGSNDGNDVDDTFIVDPSDGSSVEVDITGGIPRRYVSAWDLAKDGSKIYIFGDSDSSPDYWSIDINTLSSELMPGNPIWQGGNAFTGYDPEDGGKLMALQRVGGTYWNLVYYSLSQQKWIKMDIMDGSQGPGHDSGMASAYDHTNNDFYLYGGVYWYQSGQSWYAYHYDDFWKLDCDSGQWTKITENSLPGERGRATLAFDEERGHLFLFGGQVPLGDTNSIYRYNISSNSWKTFSLSIEPQPRREHSVEFDQNGNRMFIFGGRRNNSGSNPELNDLWTFDVIKEQWQKMPEGSEAPTLQNWAGLSYDPNSKELLLMGDAEDEMFLWREDWLGWVSEECVSRPDDWSGHGQAYSPQTRMHYAWAHDGQEVWEYTPILRTTSGEIKIKDTDGSTMIAPPGGINMVFPSSGTYSIEVTGTTDMPASDLQGIRFNLTNNADFMNVTWTTTGGIEQIQGNGSWINLTDGIDLAWDSSSEWRFTIFFEVLFTARNGDQFDIRIFPITEEARSERSQRTNIFRILTDLSVTGYKASTDLQPVVLDGGWLFGRTNLTFSHFKVTFKDATSISPDSGTYWIWMTTSTGDSGHWDYIPDEAGQITVPINGADGDWLTVWLNLTSFEGDVLHSKEFRYRLDLDPPTSPEWARVRADSFTDEMSGIDNDNTVYLTWGHIFENGSGLKGVCYSVDVNEWPAESNLTNEFQELQIRDEGHHTIYVWAVDNTSRAGPVIEANIIIDTHMVNFQHLIPDPASVLNLTQNTVTIYVTITDELSGVDPDSVQMQYSLPDRSLSDWIDIDVPDHDPNNLSFTITHELVPDIKNIIGFRATDIAGNEIRNSERYGINYFPGLSTPQARMVGPVDGMETNKDVKFSWEGGFINPLNLSFEVHIEDPQGQEHIFKTLSESLDFTPLYPGSYRWWIVSMADGMRNQTEKRTFEYAAPLVTTSVMGAYEADQGDQIAITITFKNPLSIRINLTISIFGDAGFSIKNGSFLRMDAHEEKDSIIAIMSEGAKSGQHNLELNITDDYGRSTIQVVQIKLNPVDTMGEQVDNGGGGINPIFLIIVAGLVLIIVAVIAFLMLGKRKEEDQTEEEEVERGPSLDYDPTGVVADGGIGVEPGVHMTPGMLEQRERQTNVMEISLPGKDETVSDENGDGEIDTEE